MLGDGIFSLVVKEFRFGRWWLLGDGIFSLVVKEFRFGRWWLLGDGIFSLVVKEFRFGESGEGGRKEGGWVGGGGQFW